MKSLSSAKKKKNDSHKVCVKICNFLYMFVCVVSRLLVATVHKIILLFYSDMALLTLHLVKLPVKE